MQQRHNADDVANSFAMVIDTVDASVFLFAFVRGCRQDDDDVDVISAILRHLLIIFRLDQSTEPCQPCTC